MRNVPACTPWIMLLAATGAVRGTRADELRFQGQPPYRNVEIVGFEAGELRFRLTSPFPRQLEKPVTDLERMAVTGASELNRAEQYAVLGKHLTAIRLYERALTRTNEPWRQSLIRARLLLACDRAGRFDEAVAIYVRLLGEIGYAAKALEPKQFPNQESNFYPAALNHIERGLESAREPFVRAALESLKQTILQKSRPSPKTDGPVEQRSAPHDTRDPETERIATAEKNLRQGNLAAAQQGLERLRTTVSTAGRPTVMRLSAEAALAGADTKEGVLAAGLDAMKVVVEYPGHPEAAYALYLAALVHERIGRRDLARSLLKECRTHARATSEVNGRAEKALERLRTQEAP